ncbi:MAG TPA: hypothetical protein VN213_21735 [Solirubrobacteraceae bacterium]|nr:hypothetical protein [Solirubrobacteraceae bacterium]
MDTRRKPGIAKPPKPPKQALPRDKPVKGWSRSKFGQAGRGRSGK